MKKFETFQELPKCDTQTHSEQMLWEKWWQWTCSVQGGHRPSVSEKANICEAQ